MPRELALWPRLRHPNLIRFLDYFEDNQRVYMVGLPRDVSVFIGVISQQLFTCLHERIQKL